MPQSKLLHQLYSTCKLFITESESLSNRTKEKVESCVQYVQYFIFYQVIASNIQSCQAIAEMYNL